jgi:hypothetical protein
LLRLLIVLCVVAPAVPGRAENKPAEDAADAPPAEAAEAPAPLILTRSWVELYERQRASVGIKPLPEDTLLLPLEGFTMEGIKLDHPFLLGKFTSGGDWGVSRGVLQPIRGTDTALRLGRVGDFELEGTMHAQGLGGWFILFGWDNGHGYGLYNVEMKQSGSPWFICEFRDFKALESTHGEIEGSSWQRPARLTLQMKEKMLLLKIGNTTIVEDLECPNYSEGDLIVGTYDTRYGPKRLRIQSLRIRAPE